MPGSHPTRGGNFIAATARRPEFLTIRDLIVEFAEDGAAGMFNVQVYDRPRDIGGKPASLGTPSAVVVLAEGLRQKSGRWAISYLRASHHSEPDPESGR